MIAYMIIDGQWGSTGKGLVAGYLVNKHKPTAVACNFGPNAGHTWVSDEGKRVMTCQLPTGIIGDTVEHIFIGPGAIINPSLLLSEVVEYEEYLRNKIIYIHENATLVLPKHRTMEVHQLSRISSTLKGTGAALASKVMRNKDVIVKNVKAQIEATRESVKVVTDQVYRTRLNHHQYVQIESAQGMDLSLNRGFSYPHVTSRDVTPEQVLSDVGIGHRSLSKVVASIRTYPIRVGHQYTSGKIKIGDSGPMYPDQEELTWDGLNLKEEITTVTGKVRRVFTFSDIQYTKMLEVISPDEIFLNFVNYIDPDFEGSVGKEATTFIRKLQRINDLQYQESTPIIKYLGYGPKNSDIYHYNCGDVVLYESKEGTTL